MRNDRGNGRKQASVPLATHQRTSVALKLVTPVLVK
jgi:hypothetical protein